MSENNTTQIKLNLKQELDLASLYIKVMENANIVDVIFDDTLTAEERNLKMKENINLKGLFTDNTGVVFKILSILTNKSEQEVMESLNLDEAIEIIGRVAKEGVIVKSLKLYITLLVG